MYMTMFPPWHMQVHTAIPSILRKPVTLDKVQLKSNGAQNTIQPLNSSYYGGCNDQPAVWVSDQHPPTQAQDS